jgi:DNA-directed RNA polymerase subunit RPC12/RpoP
MSKVKIQTRTNNVCKRCGWQWYSRIEGYEPLSCPKCGSLYWNRTTQEEFKQEVKDGDSNKG